MYVTHKEMALWSQFSFSFVFKQFWSTEKRSVLHFFFLIQLWQILYQKTKYMSINVLSKILVIPLWHSTNGKQKAYMSKACKQGYGSDMPKQQSIWYQQNKGCFCYHIKFRTAGKQGTLRPAGTTAECKDDSNIINNVTNLFHILRKSNMNLMTTEKLFERMCYPISNF